MGSAKISWSYGSLISYLSNALIIYCKYFCLAYLSFICLCRGRLWHGPGVCLQPQHLRLRHLRLLGSVPCPWCYRGQGLIQWNQKCKKESLFMGLSHAPYFPWLEYAPFHETGSESKLDQLALHKLRLRLWRISQLCPQLWKRILKDKIINQITQRWSKGVLVILLKTSLNDVQ